MIDYLGWIIGREVYELDPIPSPFCVAFRCDMITKGWGRTLVMRALARVALIANEN